MKKTQLIARLLMGGIYGLSVLFTVLGMMPEHEMPPDAQMFIGGLLASKYVMPFVKIIEAVCALAFLTGNFLALATVVIFPVTLNIALFHTLLEPGGMMMGILLLAANLLLAYTLRDEYASLFHRKHHPHQPAAR